MSTYRWCEYKSIVTFLLLVIYPKELSQYITISLLGCSLDKLNNLLYACMHYTIEYSIATKKNVCIY